MRSGPGLKFPIWITGLNLGFLHFPLQQDTHMHARPQTCTRLQKKNNILLRRNVGRRREQGFTALTKIKHEDFVVPQCSWKDKYYFLYERERGPGTGLMEYLNDRMAKVLNLVTLVVMPWPAWGSGEKERDESCQSGRSDKHLWAETETRISCLKDLR